MTAPTTQTTSFESESNFLVFPNGVLNLKTTEFENQVHEMKTSVQYNPVASTRLAEEVLESVFPVEEEREYALSVLSLSLEGPARNRGLTIHLGDKGSNGKSFLNNQLVEALGDYSGYSPPTDSKFKSMTFEEKSECTWHKKRHIVCYYDSEGPRLDVNFQNLHVV